MLDSSSLEGLQCCLFLLPKAAPISKLLQTFSVLGHEFSPDSEVRMNGAESPARLCVAPAYPATAETQLHPTSTCRFWVKAA